MHFWREIICTCIWQLIYSGDIMNRTLRLYEEASSHKARHDLFILAYQAEGIWGTGSYSNYTSVESLQRHWTLLTRSKSTYKAHTHSILLGDYICQLPLDALLTWSAKKKVSTCTVASLSAVFRRWPFVTASRRWSLRHISLTLLDSVAHTMHLLWLSRFMRRISC